MINQVFLAHHQIPLTVTDLSFLSESPVAQAASLLLELPFGRFSRAELLRLMTHPSFRRAQGLADAATITRFVDDAGIFFGRDSAALSGSYLPKNAASWDQGLSRLALGQLMAPDSEGAHNLGHRAVFQSGTLRMRPVFEGPAPSEDLLSFGRAARALISGLSELREGRMRLGAWADRIRAIFTTLLGGLSDPQSGEQTPELANDAADLIHLLGALDRLEALDLGELVSGRTACVLAREAIEALSRSRGPYLAEGVVVSTFLPMRAIPFRAVFIMGLAEGSFPGPEGRDPLDLREGRRAGELSAAERDRYAFLETLLCTREQLTLSYVARDEVTGDAIAPSSVLLDLMESLLPLLGAEALTLPERDSNGRLCHGTFFETLPLRRYEDPRCLLPEALVEREAIENDGDEPIPAKPSDETLKARSAGKVATDTAGTRARANRAQKISLASLRSFLDSPVQGAAKLRLHLYEEDQGEESALIEDEPLQLDHLALHRLKRLALQRCCQVIQAHPRLQSKTDGLRELARLGALSILELCDEEAECGRFPIGPLGDRTRRELLLGSLALLPQLPIAPRPIHFGGAREEAWVLGPRPPALPFLIAQLQSGSKRGTGTEDALRVELSGVTSLLSADARTIFIAAKDEKSSGLSLWRPALQGLLDHLALAACDRADLSSMSKRELVIVGPKWSPSQALETLPTSGLAVTHDSLEVATSCEAGGWCFQLPALTPELARAPLEQLVHQIFASIHDRLLPINVISEIRSSPGFDLDWGEDSAELLELAELALSKSIESAESKFPPRTAYGPIPDPFSLPWMSPQEASQVVVRRFFPLFRLLGEARRIPE